MNGKRPNRPNASWILMFVLTITLALPPSAAWAETSAQVDEVRQILEQNHLIKPDEGELNGAAIDAMVESLGDPYTEYFKDEEWEAFLSELEQNFTGIGIVMTEESGAVYIEDVIAGSPAEAAGVLPGDKLVSGDGVSFKGLSIPEIKKKMVGAENTAVTIVVEREGKNQTFRIVRRSFQLPVTTARMMGDGVGYVALTGFTSEAGTLFGQRIEELEKQGMTSLVIDLRNNGGGYVGSAQQIASLFLEDGVLASLRDRDGNEEKIPVSGGRKPYPVTVLVNENSASAPELLAGALQDYGIAFLVGTKTFGKGVVQSSIRLQSGGVIKLTVQEYFTPNGHRVDKTGLTPDLAAEGAAEQLIAAYRNAGGHQLTMTTGRGSVTINGVRVSRPDAVLQKGNDWYVNVRLAAALVRAKVGYDKKTKTVTLSRDGAEYRLKSNDSRLVNKNGFSLIEMGTLKRWFPEIGSETTGQQWKLTIR